MNFNFFGFNKLNHLINSRVNLFYSDMASYGFKKVERDNKIYWKREVCGALTSNNRKACSNTVRNGEFCHLHVYKNLQKYDGKFLNPIPFPVNGKLSVANGLVFLYCNSCNYCENYCSSDKKICRFCNYKLKTDDNISKKKVIQKRKQNEDGDMILLSENSEEKVIDIPLRFKIKTIESPINTLTPVTPGAPKKKKKVREKTKQIPLEIPEKNESISYSSNQEDPNKESESYSIPHKKKIMKQFGKWSNDVPVMAEFQQEKLDNGFETNNFNSFGFIHQDNEEVLKKIDNLSSEVSEMKKMLYNMNNFLIQQLSPFNPKTQRSGAIFHKIHQLSKQIDNVDADTQSIRRIAKDVDDNVYELTRSKKMVGQDLSNIIYDGKY